MKRFDTSKIVGAGLIAAIALATLVCSLFSPWAGDDLAYGMDYSNYYGGSILYYPRWVIRHWTYINGRAANFLATLIMYFTPLWITCVLNALATALLYWMLVKWCMLGSKSNAFITAALIAFILFGFCWWDSFFLIDVSINYVWAAAFGLSWAWIFINAKRHSAAITIAISAFSLIAGCMHEAMSASLLIGTMAWLITCRQHLTQTQKYYLWAFAAGTAVVFFSPGIWQRLGRERVADDPMWLILLKSDWLALLMLLIYGVSMIWKVQRQRLKRLMRTSRVIWPIASAASMCFSAVGGIVGRSGWFASAFALIAISQWLLPYFHIGKKANNALCAALIAIVAFHLAEWIRWQVRTGTEMETILMAYQQNPSSPVFHDFVTIEDVPPYLLNRLRLVPDADNYYELYTIRILLGDTIHQPVFLPRALADVKPWQITADGLPIGKGFATLTLAEGEIINAPSWPCDTISGMSPILPAAPIIINEKGRQCTASPYIVSDTIIYYVAPRLINPGDR